MNPISVVAEALRSIPAGARKAIYLTYAVVFLTAGAAAVGGVDVGTAPAVLGYIGVALGFTAAANVDSE